ncbi:hypothetical protein TB1_043704 [Malus domestica]
MASYHKRPVFEVLTPSQKRHKHYDSNELNQPQVQKLFDITSAGLWSHNESELTNVKDDAPDTKSAMRGKLELKTDTEVLDRQTDSSTNSPNAMATLDDAVVKNEIKESIKRPMIYKHRFLLMISFIQNHL